MFHLEVIEFKKIFLINGYKCSFIDKFSRGASAIDSHILTELSVKEGRRGGDEKSAKNK